MKVFGFLIVLALFFGPSSPEKKGEVFIVLPANCSDRIQYGADKLQDALKTAGYQVSFAATKSNKGFQIIAGEWNDPLVSQSNVVFDNKPGKEGFSIKSSKKQIIIRGSDASGTLYGFLEIADRVASEGTLPQNLNMTDQPEMVLRGACIGLQKTTYLPGRTVYEYPYTPETFPWLYDRNLWIKYLDMLVENRMNSLYLWNGHPFASLVRLKDYPYAVEVDDETFKKNEEIYSFLTHEADKRGIFVVQMFYNIIVSKPFAEKNHLKTQDRSRPIIPIIADYTRKSISAFIQKYPNVGLLVCLGEAINTEEDDVKWFTETIIPGVKDGLKALGRTDEPPILLRAHDTNAPLVMKAALPLYKNLYTMNKYNGESLTTYEPRGPWTETHKALSAAAPVHIENVHILANLEPFRYGSPDFIQKSVQAMHTIHGANGLHIYPQASYWDWPYSADHPSPRLLEMDRDWIWYKAWSRYAWNCHRDRNKEIQYWSDELGSYFGCGNHGRQVLEGYEQTGEIAPKLLRRFGITDGNRETLTLGLFMSQLVNPAKWTIYPSFYQSNGPEGEILIDYARKEWDKQPHTGETPPQIIREVVQHGEMAVQAIDSASQYVTNNREEFSRLKNDIHCYNALASFFSEKVQAAMHVLRYKYSKDIKDLDKAVPFLENSIKYYKQLVDLTKDSYLYANSMQTQQRRIPIGGDNGKNKTWVELLPYYEAELANFKKNIVLLKNSQNGAVQNGITSFSPADVNVTDPNVTIYPLEKGAKIYEGADYSIGDFAPELKGLKGVRFNVDQQISEGTVLHFENKIPVKVVVGFFNGSSKRLLEPGKLETDASANDRGQAEIKVANALFIPDLFPVNVYTFSFEPGKNSLELGKGMVLILGFMKGSQKILTRDAGLGSSDKNDGIDWLFY